MRRNLICILLFLAGICTCLSFAIAHREQKLLSEKLIRFHVIANSDSDFDQKAKLRVRDAILGRLDCENLQSREDAARTIEAKLPEIESAANKVLRRCGAAYTAKARLCMESYPTRVYPTFSLPPGDYLSLQVTLGDGKGNNWWCVVYPSICGSVGSDLKAAAAAAGFTKQEVRLVTEDAADVKIKFKLLEWMRSCRIF